MKKVKVHYPPFINWWIPKLLIKQFFCKHDWWQEYYSLNFYCKKCNKLKDRYYDDSPIKHSTEAIKAADDFIERIKDGTIRNPHRNRNLFPKNVKPLQCQTYIEKYGDEIIEKIETMPDKEFDDLLIKSGIEKCPEIKEEGEYGTKVLKELLEKVTNLTEEEYKELHEKANKDIKWERNPSNDKIGKIWADKIITTTTATPETPVEYVDVRDTLKIFKATSGYLRIEEPDYYIKIGIKKGKIITEDKVISLDWQDISYDKRNDIPIQAYVKALLFETIEFLKGDKK